MNVGYDHQLHAVQVSNTPEPSLVGCLETVLTAAEKAGWDVTNAKQAAERVKQDLERMSRKRILPQVETLEKVARYEAHLSRQLYQAMHELEAL